MAKRRAHRKNKQAWIGALVAGALIVFAGLISWYGVTALQDKKEERQNTTAISNATSTEEDLDVANELIATDERILLTPDNIAQYQKDASGARICSPDFSLAEPTKTVEYTDSVGRFTIELPYNPDWGNDKYRIAPFDELDKPIDDGTGEVKSTTQYGPISGGEGCGWYRFGKLSVREKRTFDEIKADLSKEGAPPQLAPRKAMVGDFAVVEYNYGGLCGQPTVEVIADDYNIVLWDLCGKDEVEKDQERLRGIIATLKLL